MSPEAQFEYKANPHSWLLVADDLHQQAVTLHSVSGQEFLTRRLSSGDDELTRDRSHRAVFLLCGFALENSIKAFLVYENPELIANAKLASQLQSHKLTKLSRQSVLLPYRQRGQWVLEAFEDGLDTWARYPCGLWNSTSKDEAILTEQVWRWYRRLIAAHGRKLEDLLKKGWRGPHEFKGRFRFQGEGFLR